MGVVRNKSIALAHNDILETIGKGLKDRVQIYENSEESDTSGIRSSSISSSKSSTSSEKPKKKAMSQRERT